MTYICKYHSFQLFDLGLYLTRSKIRSVSYKPAVNDTNEIYGSIYQYIHPSDDFDSIISRHKKAINNDQIEIYLDPTAISYPSRIANYSSESLTFQVIANSALEVFKDGKIIPGPLGGPGYQWWKFTDGGIYYWSLTDIIYSFSPVRLKKHVLRRVSVFDG